MLPGACVSPVIALLENFFWQKRGNNSEIKLFESPPFCVSIPDIEMNICLKFYSNPLSRKIILESVTKKCDENVWRKSVMLTYLHTVTLKDNTSSTLSNVSTTSWKLTGRRIGDRSNGNPYYGLHGRGGHDRTFNMFMNT